MGCPSFHQTGVKFYRRLQECKDFCTNLWILNSHQSHFVFTTINLDCCNSILCKNRFSVSLSLKLKAWPLKAMSYSNYIYTHPQKTDLNFSKESVQFHMIQSHTLYVEDKYPVGTVIFPTMIWCWINIDISMLIFQHFFNTQCVVQCNCWKINVSWFDGESSLKTHVQKFE